MLDKTLNDFIEEFFKKKYFSKETIETIKKTCNEELKHGISAIAYTSDSVLESWADKHQLESDVIACLKIFRKHCMKMCYVPESDDEHMFSSSGEYDSDF